MSDEEVIQGEPLDGDEIILAYPPTIGGMDELLRIVVDVFKTERFSGVGSPELTLAQRKIEEARFWIGEHLAE